MKHQYKSFLSGFILALVSVGLIVAVPVFAQGVDLKEFAQNAGFATGPSIQLIIARLIRTAISFVGIIAVAMIVYAGFLYMTSAGNTKRLETAKKILSQAIVGLIIVLASFGIVQFIIGKLIETTGVGVTTGTGGGGGSYPDNGTLSSFKLNSVNTECASAIRNLQLQLVFSKNVNASTISEGITIKQKGGNAVDGTFATKGSVVKFTPAAFCPAPNTTSHCFAANTEYELKINSALKSTSGAELSTFGNLNEFSFTTGDGVDVKGPTISMKTPTNGQSVIVGTIQILQAETKDDTGVSSVDFYSVSDDEALYSSGLDLSTSQKLVGNNTVNIFSTDENVEWDTIGYVTNKSYPLWASAFDCAGNKATATKISAVVKAANCDNTEIDEEFGETGVNCGGDPTNVFYCGKCVADTCGQTAECSPGLVCENEVCVSKPRIDSVSPGDGAIGSLVTIKGLGFGAVGGNITFLGSKPEESKSVSAYSCNGKTKWSDKEIVVQLPVGAKDGPIEVATAGPDVKKDKTNDAFGPLSSDFDVNAVKRPGLCDVDPVKGESATGTTFSGLGLGAKQGSSVIYFKDFLSAGYSAWLDTQVKAVVPNMSSGNVSTQAFTGDYRCIDAVGKETGKLCAQDSDCGAGNSCATSWCSETLAYCSANKVCAEGDGKCVSVRVGSNKLAFAVLDSAKAETKPNISYVETGWKACSGGVNNGKVCAKDDTCGGGKCESAPNWGPAGQYVTIYGTDFGTSKGQVNFTSGLGKLALGDTQFPAQCGNQFWNNTSVIVKVPEEFQIANEFGDQIVFGAYKLSLKRQDGEVSNGVDFVIVDGAPGPAVCKLDPVAGPVETLVTAYGENLGTKDGTVTFFDKQSAGYIIWENTKVTDALVPAQAKTGPVFATTQAGYTSNSVNFAVGDCQNNFACPTNTFCCDDGSCKSNQADCSLKPKESHFAYRVSTGLIPEAPTIKVACDDKTISPSPWKNWEGSSSVCLNAVVTAAFTKQMDQTSLPDNIVVEKCNEEKSDGSCKAWQKLDGSLMTDEIAFTWTPSELLPQAAYIKVTVKGGQGGVRASDAVGGAFMEKDYVWDFRTAGQNELCEVGGVNVSPADFTATVDDQSVGYTSQLISKEHQCLTISCDGQTIDWSSNFPGATVQDPTVGTALCSSKVKATEETKGNPAKIKAEVTNAVNKPKDTGDLKIDFSDPKVDAFFPNCSTACVNAQPWARFNTDIDPSTVAASAVTLYECEDSICEANELKKTDLIQNVTYNKETKTLFVDYKAGSVMAANTWYRIVLNGSSIKSTSNVPLKDSGANYGTDFSWKFKTKNSDISCGIDSINVSPDLKTLNYVGQKQEYNATTYGAPDDCDASGQALQNSSYTWNAWTSKDTPDNYKAAQGGTAQDVAFMLQNGAIELATSLPEWCTSQCLNAGATIKHTQAVCGDGIVDYNGDGKNEAEECDDKNTNSGDGCSSSCLKEGSSLTCGNKIVDAGEQCDDGNTVSGDGCGSTCLNNGSSSVGATCGDGTVDFSPQTGGEDCDDGNTKNGDGCSSQCLFEGAIAKENVFSKCGNSKVESGEDCDDGNAVSGDGCSEKCLDEGASLEYGTPSFCSDSKIGKGEECDDGNNKSGDGCNAKCLNEGASAQYDPPSFCGDGKIQTSEECDVSAGQSLAIGGYAAAQINNNAPKEVDKTTGYAVSTITAEAENVKGDATLKVDCSCESDQACGDTTKLGCGSGSCCFVRPKKKPPYQPPSGNGPGNQGYCRNTAVSVQFDQKMDPKTFGAVDKNNNGKIDNGEISNIRLELFAKNGKYIYANPSLCPSNYQFVTSGEAPSGLFAKIWSVLKNGFWNLFGKDVSAAGNKCLAPVTFKTVDISGGQKIVLEYNDLLEKDSEYQLIIVGDKNTSDGTPFGVLSENGVGLCIGNTCEFGSTTNQFKIGSQVCLLDSVSVADNGKVNKQQYESASSGFFSKKDETHEFEAQALTYRDGLGVYEPINTTLSYSWTWDWGSSYATGKSENIVDLANGDIGKLEKSKFSSVGNNGLEHVIATAKINKDTFNVPTTSGKQTSGSLEVTALVCENPWPALNSTLGFPYIEKTDPTKPSNFGFYYCRDRGLDGTTDDLPSLADPVDVTSVATAGLLQELFFKVQGTPDAIGVRVFQNPNYLSPIAWFESQKFTGTYKELEIDGYQAIQSGNTAYITAANKNGNVIYPNIYVVSYNPNAGADAKEIFAQIFDHWKFNANTTEVSNVGLCKIGNSYVQNDEGDFINCAWDGECLETFENDECTITKNKPASAAECPLASAKNAFCDNDKSKLQNDMQRLTDITTTISALNKYGSQNKHCSVTKNQGCSTDSQCPGTESCVEGYPEVQQGTYVPAMSVSKWESWNAVLSNAVGSTLPKDPIDEFWQGCKSQGEGFDPLTCFNGLQGKFVCPKGSHVYGYQNKYGEKYKLFTQLEYGDSPWNFAIDQFDTDDVTVVAEYLSGLAAVPKGFVSNPLFCADTASWGISAVCGDGVVGQNETCEPGQVKAEYLSDGYVNVSCKDDCSNYQTVAEAQAAGSPKIDFACGNGVLEGSEICDDGAQNGTYGHCGSDCTFTKAFLCGDGYLAGGEQCDCGSIENFASLGNQSWAKINSCESSNGQYGDDPGKTCTYDCKQPGLSCGDKIVNGPEECDGGSQQWAGKLCTDNKTTCETDSDCPSGACGGGNQKQACGSSKVCVEAKDVGKQCGNNNQCESGKCNNSKCLGVDDIGTPCSNNAQCGSKKCSDFTYELTRTRVCKNDCSWPGFSSCQGGDQVCGNGKIEGTEECDDGNKSNNDSCTNGCKKNFCGDEYVYSGVEACDNGIDNVGPNDLNPCEASYDNTCNYCNWQCQYKTLSGSYCGDGIKNGNEFCDGNDQPYWCFNYDTGAEPVKAGNCSKSDALKLGPTGACSAGYTCQYLGVCNGGANNGKPCTLQPPNKTPAEYNASANKFVCGTDSQCVAPVCASDCSGSCPFTLKKTGILVQSELSGAQPLPSVDLYSYFNKEKLSPDNAVLLLPACSVGTKITANIDNSNVTEPNIDIVFVTDLTGTMKLGPDGKSASAPNRRIDIVTEAAKQAIDDLYDAYQGTDGKIRIGLVTYGYGVDYNHNVQDDVIALHPELETSLVPNNPGNKETLKNIIDTYKDNFGGWTLTGSAIQKAIKILDEQSAPENQKFVILLADGEANHALGDYSKYPPEKAIINDNDDKLKCNKMIGDNKKNYNKEDGIWVPYEGTEACIAEARYADGMIFDHIKSGDITFYSAVISDNTTQIAYMEHLSSLKCAGKEMADKNDCTEGNFAYQATTADGIKGMYNKIIESVLESKTTVTATKGTESSSETSITPVGQNVELPLPETFACQNKQTLMPIQTIFNGTGTMNFSNITFEYCPVP
ncbi:Ig-like domain-containing protein [Candidatus Uhrbacteria bacterium]|nr:Ig-like domain-containing protein [Candidatus Uhrbacteria bacterium]